MIPLRIEHLTKSYGKRRAVDDLSLEITAGTVFGLLGRNGAGKTTALGCVLGLTRFGSGTIRLFGEPLKPAVFNRVAFVPEHNVLDDWMTPLEHERFRRGVFARFDGRLLRELYETFEVEPGRKVGKLSKGQQQAVALALAFAQRPDLAILDEPSSGLDPVLQRRLLDTIVGCAADGMTILFSSHQIGQVELAAERVGIIDKGRLILESDVDDLRAARALVEAYYERPPDLSLVRFSSPIETDGSRVRVLTNGDTAEVEAALQALSPLSLSRREATLEQVFFSTVGAGKEYRS